MKRLFLITTPMLVTSILLAACGGSSQTAGSGGGNASSASTTSNGGGGVYSGVYGGSSSGSSSSTTSSSNTSSATPISTKHTKLGMVLAAGPKRLTVYLFEGDKGSASACSGACASAWPPVTTSAKPAPHGQAVAADLATIMRSDGTKQVTYKGRPLYYFVRDKTARDAYGQGVKAFGAGWYAVAPSGQKIDNS